MEFWLSAGIKGSFYIQPLLVVGSGEYECYMDIWNSLASSLNVNPNNIID